MNILLYSWSGMREEPVSEHQVGAISPIAHVCKGRYSVPTFTIQGLDDKVMRYSMSVAFDKGLRAQGKGSVLLVVEGAEHMDDLDLRSRSEEGEKGVGLACSLSGAWV